MRRSVDKKFGLNTEMNKMNTDIYREWKCLWLIVKD